MKIGEKLLRASYGLLGLILLPFVLVNLFFVPVNTVFECKTPNGNCKVEERYFFFKNSRKFNIHDLNKKKLTSVGNSYSRTYSLRLDTPEFGFIAGKFRSETQARKMLTLLNNFQADPTGEPIYMNEDGYIDHIFVTIFGFIIIFFFCWVGIKPPKSLKWV